MKLAHEKRIIFGILILLVTFCFTASPFLHAEGTLTSHSTAPTNPDIDYENDLDGNGTLDVIETEGRLDAYTPDGHFSRDILANGSTLTMYRDADGTPRDVVLTPPTNDSSDIVIVGDPDEFSNPSSERFIQQELEPDYTTLD